MGKDVIIALDFQTADEALNFLCKFDDNRPFVKVGMELFYSTGPTLIKELKDRGHKVFLDLKMHDIPNTVKKAMQSISKLGVDMTNVHAGGGIEMMKKALEGVTNEEGDRPILIAVTQLTSTSQSVMKEELLIAGNIDEVVQQYAANAKSAGLDGVVCSPMESPIIHESLDSDFITVTPGIRYKDGSMDDQVRVTTPADARKLTSDYIVVGRPITKADDPVSAYQRCLKDFKGGEKDGYK